MFTQKRLDTITLITQFVRGTREVRRRAVTIFGLAALLIFGMSTPGAWAVPGDLLHSFYGTAGDQFGFSVACVGNNVLVGAPYYDNDNPNVMSTDSGAAFLFDSTTGSLSQTILNPSTYQSDYDHFGKSVAGAGNSIVVGAPDDDRLGYTDSGIAYTFDGTGSYTGWAGGTLGDNDRFGNSVAVAGDNILVGAQLDNGGGYYSHRIDDGAAYVYNNGSYQFPLSKPSPQSYDKFGSSVAGVGSNFLVGATGAEEAYLFDSSGSLLHTFTNPLGSYGDFGVSVAAVGNNVLVGARLSNKAYLYDGLTGDLLHTFANPLGNNGQFGSSVAGVGNNVLVGAPWTISGGTYYTGAAYLFDGTTGSLIQTYLNPTSASYDYFGNSVAGVGNNILIGAFGYGNASGAAYLFEGPEPIPEPATIALLGIGLAGLAGVAARRRLKKRALGKI